MRLIPDKNLCCLVAAFFLAGCAEDPVGPLPGVEESLSPEVESLISGIEKSYQDLDLDGDGVLATDELLVAERLGFNLVVGAQGDPRQLYLNTIHGLQAPIENIPYSLFLEFLTKDEPSSPLKREQDGRFGLFVHKAVPVGLGDYWGEFRVFATTPQFFETDGKVADDSMIRFEFVQGRSFVTRSDEHGHFEAVVGAAVAKARDVKIGDELTISHGASEGHSHDSRFVVVGILEPTGSSLDRKVYVNLEGFYLVAGHAKPLDESEESDDLLLEEELLPPGVPEVPDDLPAEGELLPLEQREVTAILLRVDPLFAISLPNVLREEYMAQAIFPSLIELRYREHPFLDEYGMAVWFATQNDGISISALRERMRQFLRPLKKVPK